MPFDSATHCELRSHHGHCTPRVSYETWLSGLIRTFESEFPDLPVSTHPNTFLVWVRANTTAILAVSKPNKTIH
jgi:hypothetical protein